MELNVFGFFSSLLQSVLLRSKSTTEKKNLYEYFNLEKMTAS